MRALVFAVAVLVVLSTSACTGSRDATPASSLSVTFENGLDRATYGVSCWPAGGDARSQRGLCLLIMSNPRAMLHEKYPGQTCIGGYSTTHVHVSGQWEGQLIDADVDACSGNPEGQRLWTSQLHPELKPF